MPGHLFARLGLRPHDIQANLASVEASHKPEQREQNGGMEQFHARDFLIYAYLQSGQDIATKELVNETRKLLGAYAAMSEMSEHSEMLASYQIKYPVFYDPEMRDWQAAAALVPLQGAPHESQTLTYWCRIIGAGHLHSASQSRADLATYESLPEEVRKGRHAYQVNSTGSRIERGEALACVAFAEGDSTSALKQMAEAAELQDRVGPGEVDIPARGMLADMLLEPGQPVPALAEYERSLRLSPNRLTGLYNAGRAAQAAADRALAAHFYTKLMQTTNAGSQSNRSDVVAATAYLADLAQPRKS
jgi:tetratricopeptide (TPR) repeat protein